MPSPRSPFGQLNELVGTVVDGRYRVEAMIGSGGMGAIFRAYREGLSRPLALKVLHPAVTADPTTIKRFEREAVSASKLDHPNCVRVSDHGSTDDGLSYLAMELVEGTQLSSLLGEPMAPATAADLIGQVLEALDHAHSRNIVHRDLKPDNILVARDGEGDRTLKLVDFGIAKILEDKQTQERLTQTGFVYGTPHYMSPEQAAGGQIDHRADLYAVGIILYEMLTGRRPFQALDPMSMMRKQVTQAHDALPADVPKRLAAIVDRLLEKDPKDRYQSARDALNALGATRMRLEGVPAAKLPVGPPAAEAPTMAQPAQAADAETVASPQAGVQPAASVSTSAARSHSAARSRASARSQSSPRDGGGSMLPWMITGVAVLVGGVAFGLWFFDQDSSAAQATVVAEEETATETGEAATGETGPALSENVTIVIKTNVDAQVIDEVDGGVFGMTNGDGFEVERSDVHLRLLLRAEGYEDRFMQIRPTRDKHYEAELREAERLNFTDLKDPFRQRGNKKGKQKGKQGAAPEPAPAPAPPSEDDAEKSGAVDAPNLEDPFKKTVPKRAKGKSPELADPFEKSGG